MNESNKQKSKNEKEYMMKRQEEEDEKEEDDQQEKEPEWWRNIKQKNGKTSFKNKQRKKYEAQRK